jgi:Sulfotransferase family
MGCPSSLDRRFSTVDAADHRVRPPALLTVGVGDGRFDRMAGRKPTLFLIGAMKSGTTYLRKLLHAHPAIFMCDPDEPSYFVDPRQLKALWPDMWERGFWRSEAHYLQLFGAAGAATILGEASTSYTKHPLVSGVPERIGAFSPDARFVYLMRDPVERTLSHYWHMVRYHAEHRLAAEAVRRDSQFVAVSDYAMQLAPFLQRFGRERVAVLTHEDLVRDPVAVMRSLYGWLGVDPAAAEMAGFARPEHVTPEVIRAPLWGGLPRRLRQSSPLRRLVPYIPLPVQAALRRVTNRDVWRQSVDVGDAIGFLRPIQRRQTEELARMLGRDFPEWTTLYGEERRPTRLGAGVNGVSR